MQRDFQKVEQKTNGKNKDQIFQERKMSKRKKVGIGQLIETQEVSVQTKKLNLKKIKTILTLISMIKIMKMLNRFILLNNE